MNDQPFVAVATGVYLGTEGVDVQFRFGTAQPSAPEQWVSSNSGTVIYPFFDSTEFTVSALAAPHVIFQATDYRGVVYTYEFPLQGFRDALSRLVCTEQILREDS